MQEPAFDEAFHYQISEMSPNVNHVIERYALVFKRPKKWNEKVEVIMRD